MTTSGSGVLSLRESSMKNQKNSGTDETQSRKNPAADFMSNFFGDFQAMNDATVSYLNLANKIVGNPATMVKSQQSFADFLQNQMELSRRIFERQGNGKYEALISPKADDKRFKAPEWEEQPYFFDYIKQNYLLVSKMVTEIMDSIEIEEKSKDKLKFYTQQYLDAVSPSNFLMTNPEALKLAYETQGKSVMNGFDNFIKDFNKGDISQTDESVFEVGKNLATTKGDVVFENEIMQLIQYNAQTTKVSEHPLLMIPPWINKYYILDLHEDRSLVEFSVKQGHTTFMISWKNPTKDMGYISFDDYVIKGALKAIEVTRKISHTKKIDVLGYCIGGTLLGITLAILGRKEKTFPEADQEKDSINSATFMATMLDFSDIGPMGAIVDEALVTKIENELATGGVLKGNDLAKAFNALRPNELVWHYVVNNYLKGKNPPPFSVLYWTRDSTNLPAKMYTFYLRKMIYENKLSTRNAIKIGNTPIDLGKIKVPVYVIGTVFDHIAPCQTAFTTTELLDTDIEFVLGDSGHIMGAINPPSQKNKYNHHINGELGKGFEHWKNTAAQQDGSWWPHWNRWLKQKSKKDIPAPKKTGNAEYKPIEPAPGRYVKEKCC